MKNALWVLHNQLHYSLHYNQTAFLLFGDWASSLGEIIVVVVNCFEMLLLPE